MDVCTHPGVLGGLCIRCGQKMDDESGVAFGYIHKVAILKILLLCQPVFIVSFHGCGCFETAWWFICGLHIIKFALEYSSLSTFSPISILKF